MAEKTNTSDSNCPNGDPRTTEPYRTVAQWAHDDDGKGISPEADAWAEDEVGLCGMPDGEAELRAMLASVFEAGRRLEHARMAALTDKWLCEACDPAVPVGQARSWAVMVAEVRELLPSDTRYDNG